MTLVNLIGTFHADLAGLDLMKISLEKLCPEIIVGESNDFLEAKSEFRTKLWDALFDDYNIPEEQRNRFYLMEVDKEHFVSKMYSKENRVPYLMVDLPEEYSQEDLNNYAQIDVINQIRSMNYAASRETIIKLINVRFYSSLSTQGNKPPCPKYYQPEFCVGADSNEKHSERDRYMAEQIKNIMVKNLEKRIVGFFGLLHVIEPDSDFVRRVLKGKLQNVRYHLGSQRVNYSKLIDFVPADL